MSLRRLSDCRPDRPLYSYTHSPSPSLHSWCLVSVRSRDSRGGSRDGHLRVGCRRIGDSVTAGSREGLDPRNGPRRVFTGTLSPGPGYTTRLTLQSTDRSSNLHRYLYPTSSKIPKVPPSPRRPTPRQQRERTTYSVGWGGGQDETRRSGMGGLLFESTCNER